MSDYADWERALYRGLTGNRLSERTYTPEGALRDLARTGGKEPWKAVGASRETWRRWHLPEGAKNHQRPGPRHREALLKHLRRSRLSAAREQRIRANPGVHVSAISNYEDKEPRELGSQTLQWSPTANGRIVDAYLRDGIGAAALVAIDSIGSRHFADWMHPTADGSGQSYDVTTVDLTHDHHGRTRRRGR